MKRIVDITGKKFGKLVVIELDTTLKNKLSYWLCKCDCGKTKIVHGHRLRYGVT